MLQVCNNVAKCVQMLQSVYKGCKLCTKVAKCVKILQSIYKCCKVCKMLQSVYKCCKVYPTLHYMTTTIVLRNVNTTWENIAEINLYCQHRGLKTIFIYCGVCPCAFHCVCILRQTSDNNNAVLQTSFQHMLLLFSRFIYISTK